MHPQDSRLQTLDSRLQTPDSRLGLKLSVVIPAYNEEKHVVPTVEGLSLELTAQQIPFEIIVVDDNSRDGTSEAVEQLRKQNPAVRLVRRQPPSGFGRAIRSGLDAVQGDVVVVYMADASDDPKDVVAYYRKILEGYDCVFGSRFIPGASVENYPPVKRVVNRIVNKCIQWLFWCKYNDLTNAFKAYRTDVIRECGPFRSSHFNLTIEMSLAALVRRYNITQIPIRWQGRTWGQSNLKLREMGRRYLAVLVKAWAERMLLSDDMVAERLASRCGVEVSRLELQKRVEKLEQRIGDLETTAQPVPVLKEPSPVATQNDNPS
ncbi:MAG TPA: glycosyltransferase family 2 protein [Planctomycetota bacterium]